MVRVSRIIGVIALVAALGIAGVAAKGYHQQPVPVEARGGLYEYSVIYTDRATNSMSTTFQKVRPHPLSGELDSILMPNQSPTTW